MRGFKLENELISLNPRDFDSNQEFFKNLKSLRLQLTYYGIHKQDSQLILSFLSQLGPNYSIFVSTIYVTQDALGTGFTMPSLDDFSSSLTRQKAKLASMGMVKSSSSQALITSQEPKDQKGSIGKGKK